MPRALRPETTHLVFHTAAWPGDPSRDDIDRAHRDQGWAGIGYHYVIRKDGSVEVGEDERRKGAHCRDSGMNAKAVGVCFSGHHGDDFHSVTGEPWTAAQREAWHTLAADLCRRFQIPVDRVIGHREAGARKACPGDRIDCDAVRAELRTVLGGIVPRPTLRKGDDGAHVRALQEALALAGDYRAGIDGDFGPRTDRAVRALQTRIGLEADGVAGRCVWGALRAVAQALDA